MIKTYQISNTNRCTLCVYFTMDCFVLAQDVYTAGDSRVLWSTFPVTTWFTAMAGDTSHRLLTHSLILMFDQQLHCWPMFSVLPPAINFTTGVQKQSFLSLEPVKLYEAMLCLLLFVYFVVFRNTFKYRPNIKYRYMHFFYFQYKYTQSLYSNTYSNINTHLEPTVVPDWV